MSSVDSLFSRPVVRTVGVLGEEALERRREAVRRARQRSRELTSTRQSVSRHPPTSASWMETLGSPHGPWNPWTLLAAFEAHTVFGSVDEGGIATFACASCDVTFPTKLWVPTTHTDDRVEARTVASSSERTASHAHNVPPLGVDNETPSVVAERLLIATIRHHCATAVHAATLRKLWPDRHRDRSPSHSLELDALGRSRNYIVVKINGVRTLVSRQVGGSSAFEPEGMDMGDDLEHDVSNDAWLHHAATAFSTDAAVILRTQVADHRADGRVSRSRRRDVRITFEPSAPWNPTDASFSGGAVAAAGSAALIEQVGVTSQNVAVRAVEMPVARRDDTCADFAHVSEGHTYRVLRARPATDRDALQQRQLPQPAQTEDDSRAHVTSFVDEQVAVLLARAHENEPLVAP
jgi:hypothetical protein